MYDVSTLCRRFRTTNSTLYEAFRELGLEPAYQRGSGRGSVRLYDSSVIDSNEGRITSTLKRMRFEANSAAAKRVVEERRAGLRPMVGAVARPNISTMIDELTAKVDRLLALWDIKPVRDEADGHDRNAQ